MIGSNELLDFATMREFWLMQTSKMEIFPQLQGQLQVTIE